MRKQRNPLTPSTLCENTCLQINGTNAVLLNSNNSYFQSISSHCRSLPRIKPQDCWRQFCRKVYFRDTFYFFRPCIAYARLSQKYFAKIDYEKSREIYLRVTIHQIIVLLKKLFILVTVAKNMYALAQWRPYRHPFQNTRTLFFSDYLLGWCFLKICQYLYKKQPLLHTVWLYYSTCPTFVLWYLNQCTLYYYLHVFLFCNSIRTHLLYTIYIQLYWYIIFYCF